MSGSIGTGPPPGWPPALWLLVLLIRLKGLEDGPDRTAAIRDARAMAASFGDADWGRFADLAIARHRVASLVAGLVTGHGSVLDVPAPIAAQLSTERKRNAVVTLGQIAETRRLIEHFAGIGVEPVIFKGWPLSARLHGDPALRHTGDLDLLIPHDRLADSCAMLGGLGYQQVERYDAHMGLLESAVIRDEIKDIRFVHAGQGHIIELHWNMHPFRGWSDPLAGAKATARQETGIGPLLCPADSANMLYLSVHGTLHIWSRLKWLADIAPLARRRGVAGLEEDLEMARALGLYPTVAVTLRLSSHLFGSPLPESVARDASLDGMVHWMLVPIGRDDILMPIPSYGHRIRTRIAAWRLASTVSQRLGLLHYDTVRRFRLWWAGIA